MEHSGLENIMRRVSVSSRILVGSWSNYVIVVRPDKHRLHIFLHGHGYNALLGLHDSGFGTVVAA